MLPTTGNPLTFGSVAGLDSAVIAGLSATGVAVDVCDGS